MGKDGHVLAKQLGYYNPASHGRSVLALKLLSGEFHEGELIRVERGEQGLVFSASIPTGVVEV